MILVLINGFIVIFWNSVIVRIVLKIKVVVICGLFFKSVSLYLVIIVIVILVFRVI